MTRAAILVVNLMENLTLWIRVRIILDPCGRVLNTVASFIGWRVGHAVTLRTEGKHFTLAVHRTII